MDVPAGIPYKPLEQCNYRYLQKLAKSQGLPSNVKKILLIKMINAKKYCSPEQVASLIAQIKEQRKQSSKQRKVSKKTKGLQVTEISSTNNPSPPICTTPLRSWSPMPNLSRQPPKTYSNINTIKKQGAESDRVLRSFNNKLSNTNYIKIEKVDIVSVEVSSATELRENQYEDDMCMQGYSSVGADSLVQRPPSLKTSNALPRPRLYNANQRQKKIFLREKQLVPFTSSSVVANRERRLSGISPLQPTHVYQSREQAQISGKEGQNILNAFLRKKIGPESLLKNKITQTNIKRPIIVRNALQQKTVRMYKSLSSSSTESARESGSDVEIQSRMIRSFQDSFESVAVPANTLRLMNKDYSIENFATTQAEMNRAEQFDKSRTLPNVQVMSRSVDGRKRNFYIIDNHMHGNVSALEKRAKNIIDKRDNVTAIDNRAKNVIDDRRNAIIAMNKAKNVDAIDNRATMGNSIYKMNSENQMRLDMAENIDKFKKSYIMIPSKSNIDQQNRRKVDNKNENENRSFNLKADTVTENLTYSDNTNSRLEHQNPVNVDENMRIYPNMSALSDVYPENHVEVISEMGNSEVYFHKKIRAEKVRVQRLSLSVERPRTPVLPHINEVFNKLKDPRFQHLMQPIFVDCGNDAATVLTAQPVGTKEIPRGPLDSIYNYLWSGLEQPLDFHHTIHTTSTTTTYTTHLTTTPAVCNSPPPYTSCIKTAQLGKPRNSVYAGGLLCLLDDLKMYEQQAEGNKRGEEVQRDKPRDNVHSGGLSYLQDYPKSYEREGNDMSCKEELSRSPLSDVVDAKGSGPASIEDVLDVISQDGDYMERIGMGLRMQCVVCDWTGPNTILEYHVALEHPTAVTLRSSPSWSSTVSLAGAASGSRHLSKYDGRVYVVSVACDGTTLRADIAMLPKDDDLSGYTEKCGRLTTYNKMSGEPYYWEGIIPTMSDFTDIVGLKVELADLQLVPNADLVYADGQWVIGSNEMASQIDVNEIGIVIHVQIY